MRSEVAEDLKNSLTAFEHTVWPAISHLCGGGTIRHLEGSEHQTDRHLDTLAGIDAYIIQNGGMRGIASRIQPSSMSWDTFTIRLSRESGAHTEYEKRRAAANSDGKFLFPHLTIQAYTAATTGDLIAAAMIRTKDLIGHTESCRQSHEDWAKRPDARCYYQHVFHRGTATFVVVPWAHLQAAGVQVGIVRSAANGNQ